MRPRRRRVWCFLAHRWWAPSLRWPSFDGRRYLCDRCGETWSKS